MQKTTPPDDVSAATQTTDDGGTVIVSNAAELEKQLSEAEMMARKARVQQWSDADAAACSTQSVQTAVAAGGAVPSSAGQPDVVVDVVEVDDDCDRDSLDSCDANIIESHLKSMDDMGLRDATATDQGGATIVTDIRPPNVAPASPIRTLFAVDDTVQTNTVTESSVDATLANAKLVREKALLRRKLLRGADTSTDGLTSATVVIAMAGNDSE